MFSYSGSLSYYNFNIDLCASCADEAIDNEVEDVYYEDCEKCGKKFDLIRVRPEIDATYGDDAYDMLGNYLCKDCAEAELG